MKPTLAAPTTSFMNWYEAGANVQLANAGVVTVDQSVLNDPEFFILVSESTHAIVDLFGFFAEPQATPLDCFEVNNSVVVVNGGQIGSPPGLIASCPGGYRLTGGGNLYTGNSSGFWSWNSHPSGQSWITAGRNETGASATVAVYAQCCRVPGRP